ncbi:hypothetical protein FH972_011113 [Carpinus fangiana]|uniref:Uncharacterized protein n=1 Tax=Carpinus fangiana TaxID=176857 RepID=A0A660KSC2_9ROSI|nr:hypothetical protein FH972_011113 [Carpinus fangiana]
MTANISGREFEQEEDLRIATLLFGRRINSCPSGKFLVSVLDQNSFVRTEKLLLVQKLSERSPSHIPRLIGGSSTWGDPHIPQEE